MKDIMYKLARIISPKVVKMEKTIVNAFNDKAHLEAKVVELETAAKQRYWTYFNLCELDALVSKALIASGKITAKYRGRTIVFGPRTGILLNEGSDSLTNLQVLVAKEEFVPEVTETLKGFCLSESSQLYYTVELLGDTKQWRFCSNPNLPKLSYVLMAEPS